jgi:hypothetical protein
MPVLNSLGVFQSLSRFGGGAIYPENRFLIDHRATGRCWRAIVVRIRSVVFSLIRLVLSRLKTLTLIEVLHVGLMSCSWVGMML